MPESKRPCAPSAPPTPLADLCRQDYQAATATRAAAAGAARDQLALARAHAAEAVATR